jgi:hypothetical protein
MLCAINRVSTFRMVSLSTAILFGAGGDRWTAGSWAQEPTRAAKEAPTTPSLQTPISEAIELEPGFELLFDGRTFDGWEGNFDWFRIESGAIVAGSLERDIPHNEFLCTRQSFKNFELKLQVKLEGTGDNAGVQFRTVRLPNSTEVSGYQCDVGNAWGRPVWGGLYDESRRNKMLAEGDPKTLAQALRPGTWNELMVRAIDDHVQIWLNGTLTIEYTETDPKIAREGIIALQIHSGPPTEAWYRHIRLRRIDPK